MATYANMQPPLLSPPDTEKDQRVSTEQPAARFRRIAYNASPRVPAPINTPRHLLIILPAPNLMQDLEVIHSHAAHGSLLPLCHTLYAQLVSIAREYGFPSSQGISVFLQVPPDGFGMSLAPRVADETWQILWASHMQDFHNQPQLPMPHPIAGRLQFDIDTRKARWWDGWLAARTKEAATGTHHSDSPSHSRGPSLFNDMASVAHDEPAIQRNSIPRKLSLLDRVAVRPSVSRLASSSTTLVVDRSTTNLAEASSSKKSEARTNRENDEPSTARVLNWRASAQSEAPALPTTPPPPSATQEELLENEATRSLHLSDFAWSPSTQGPVSAFWPPPLTPITLSERSVGLDRRAEGSVALSATTETSWGPPDSPYSSYSGPRSFVPRHLRSPGLADRALSDVPVTPTTATSWGPDSDYAELEVEEEDLPWWRRRERRPITPDVGLRALSDAPLTASTATSWGPVSPQPRIVMDVYTFVDENMRTPDLGERTTFDDAAQRPRQFVWPHVTMTELQVSDPWPLVWPYREPEVSQSPVLFRHVWPYNGMRTPPRVASEPWLHVWPYLSASQPQPGPSREGWNQVWPHVRDLDSALSGPWMHTWPYTAKSSVTNAKAVYPYFNLYPVRAGECTLSRDPGVQVRNVPAYPRMTKYASVYPNFNLYPPVTAESCAASPKVGTLSTKKSELSNTGADYPYFRLFAAAYPHFNLYPARAGECAPSKDVTWRKEVSYPHLVIYASVYPYFNLYPPTIARSGSTGSTVTLPADKDNKSVVVAALYPFITLYTPIYPHFDLYPSRAAECATSKSIESRNPAAYPRLKIYAPDFYPSVAAETRKMPSPQATNSRELRNASVELFGSYGRFNIYPNVYPHLVVYPPMEADMQSYSNTSTPITSSYGRFKIYHAQYPHFDIYPALDGAYSFTDPNRISHFDRRRISTSVPRRAHTPSPTTRRTLPRRRSVDRVSSSSIHPLTDAGVPPVPALPPTVSLSRHPSTEIQVERNRRKHAELHALVLAELGSRHMRHPQRTHANLAALVRLEDSLHMTPISAGHFRRTSSLLGPRTMPISPAIRSTRASNPVETQNQSLLLTSAAQSASPHSVLDSTLSATTPPSSLGRVRSMALPKNVNDLYAESFASVQRTNSVSRSPLRSKRDSLVLERARAFNGPKGSTDLSALGQIPLPPSRSPVARLDRSKYPFA